MTPATGAPFHVAVPRTLTLVVSASIGQGVGFVGNAKGVGAGPGARLSAALAVDGGVAVGTLVSPEPVVQAVKTRTSPSQGTTTASRTEEGVSISYSRLHAIDSVK